jgi:hypothetical protein
MVSKGDPKKIQAYKIIAYLVSCLPSDKIYMRLGVPELWSLLVTTGVAAEIDDANICVAMAYHSCGLFELHHFGEKRGKYYHHATCCAGDPTTPCSRGTVSLELPSDYLKRPYFQNDVEFVAAFLSTTATNNNTSLSRKRPAEDSSLVTPTFQLPCTVMSHFVTRDRNFYRLLLARAV